MPGSYSRQPRAAAFSRFQNSTNNSATWCHSGKASGTSAVNIKNSRGCRRFEKQSADHVRPDCRPVSRSAMPFRRVAVARAGTNGWGAFRRDAAQQHGTSPRHRRDCGADVEVSKSAAVGDRDRRCWLRRTSGEHSSRRLRPRPSQVQTKRHGDGGRPQAPDDHMLRCGVRAFGDYEHAAARELRFRRQEI